MKGVYSTDSPQETEDLGAEFSRGLYAGEIVGLSGDLGCGKTRFVKGIARGLGAKGCVKSPSFTIINIYEGGSIELYHIDLYRIGGADEFHCAGLEEFIYGKGISVIEWADKLPALLDECDWVVRFSHRGESKREIEIERRSGPR
ncbi:MAG: tRNA (adenosine(37)-N6)-threonylcarbamoyltransferase complex ATPase subunit type 1 TsaE [Deltaproteobacteria bacterium]|nr:tRNA (adenosine(37)-N6)-threonylcarbamoyltransferase complex ATPase subunit type 1 TsaE [Deltaproteobacteria bacterium]